MRSSEASRPSAASESKIPGDTVVPVIATRIVEWPFGSRLPEVRRPEGDANSAGEPALDDRDARIARLERIAALHEKGVLDDEEFATEKARVLALDQTAE